MKAEVMSKSIRSEFAAFMINYFMVVFLSLVAILFSDFIYADSQARTLHINPENASDYMIRVEIENPNHEVQCTRVYIEMNAKSGGDGIRDIFLNVPGILNDQEVFLHLGVFNSPPGAEEKQKSTSFCMPEEILEKATVDITYGVPQALCVGDTYRIKLLPFLKSS